MAKRYNSPSISLFEQLGAGLDILGQVPVPKTHRYAEDADQGEIAPAQIPAQPMQAMQGAKDMTEMKFTHSLIKHLDVVYSKMLAGEISEITEEDPDVKYIAGMPMVEKHSYYNTGNSNVTESF
tara:strand:+ start:588 stop:959 length:372 start_codon:yes stop_codon:yes gene_type:complete